MGILSLWYFQVVVWLLLRCYHVVSAMFLALETLKDKNMRMLKSWFPLKRNIKCYCNQSETSYIFAVIKNITRYQESIPVVWHEAKNNPERGHWIPRGNCADQTDRLPVSSALPFMIIRLMSGYECVCLVQFKTVCQDIRAQLPFSLWQSEITAASQTEHLNISLPLGKHKLRMQWCYYTICTLQIFAPMSVFL